METIAIGDLVGELWSAVRRAPHLYALTVAYWIAVSATLVTRYVLGRRERSERYVRAVAVIGCVSLVLAFVDAAVRGQELVQVSLVAYFATPLGVGRYLLARWDGEPVEGWRGLGMRQVTYLVAFAAFVALSVVDGDPWWFTRPDVDRTDAAALITGTNWFHLMASVFGLVAVMELLSGVPRRPRPG